MISIKKISTVIVLAFLPKLLLCQVIENPIQLKADTFTNNCCVTIKQKLGNNIIHYRIYQRETMSLWKEYTKINDTIHGTETEYYKNGPLKTVRTYCLGIPIGMSIDFYENGNVASYYDYGYSANDKNLKQTLITKEYTSNAPPYDTKTETFGYYKPLNGNYYYFYDNGGPKKMENYLNNELDGKTIHYDINGKIISVEEYKNGILIPK